jgi:hypothetical protein
MLSVSRFANNAATPELNRINRPPAERPVRSIDKHPRASGALPLVGSRAHA